LLFIIVYIFHSLTEKIYFKLFDIYQIKKSALSVKYPVCSSDCKTWNIQPPHRERKRKKKRMSLLYRLPLRRFSFADIAKAFPRFNEPRGSRQRVDRRKSTGEKREEKRKSHGRSLPRVTKNTPVEYRLTTVRSTGYFVLSWKSNVFRCARCVL